MPAASQDAIARILCMMQNIPIYPRWVTAKQVLAGLEREGYSISRRTVERDLNRFSTFLGLVSGESPEGNKWSYASDTSLTFLPALSASEALSIKMVQKHLQHHLPPFLFSNMSALFAKSDKVLAKNRPYNEWIDKVALVAPGMPIKPHQADSVIVSTLYQALMENRKVRIQYFRKKTEFVVRLLGLIVRDNKLIFVCNYDGFSDTRMILAHRIHTAQLLDEKHTTPFNLSDYANSGQPGSVMSCDTIRLELHIKGYVKLLLSESVIGKNQKLVPIDDVWTHFSVDLVHSMELESWLLGYVDYIKVLAPESVKSRILARLQSGIANQEIPNGD